VLYNNGAVAGVATGDMGIGKSGQHKDSFTRGMELRAKNTLFAEGARGSLSKQLIAKYGLADGREPQKFGLGLKELWQVAPGKHRPGLVQHSFGWPLDNSTGGGSFLYHFDDNLVSVGFVVHLNYSNPYLSPFEEFQRFKTHPAIRDTFEGGKRLSYGARAITEGGYQSVPKLSFPGGALIGCAAGFINLPRIKGSHNAILSGMLAAEHVAEALAEGRTNDELSSYDEAWSDGEIGADLWKVRNAKPLWSRLGTILGIAAGGFDMWCNTLGFSFLGTLGHGKADADTLKPAAECQPIAYPKPDGKLTFDRLSSVFLSSTNHRRTSRHICVLPIWRCRSHPSTTSTPVLRRAIARLAFTSGWRRAVSRGTSSTRRTACTVRRATSKTLTATLPGCHRKAAVGRNIPICDGGGGSSGHDTATPRFFW
jgi:electron-transferring-flavoprotein dehydrogenase